MSKYTTGETEKLCRVSVRTVQDYDTRNLLDPSERTENGRRLSPRDDRDLRRPLAAADRAMLPYRSSCLLYFQIKKAADHFYDNS